MKKPDDEYRAILRDYMLANGLSGKLVSRACGIEDHSALRRWLRGKSGFALGRLASIERFLTSELAPNQEEINLNKRAAERARLDRFLSHWFTTGNVRGDLLNR